MKMPQIARNIAVRLLGGYKRALSPLLPPACRYVPTCSEYAMEAVDRFGIFRGGLMVLWRLLRCHPFVKGGYDPVPQDAKAGCRERTGHACQHGL